MLLSTTLLLLGMGRPFLQEPPRPALMERYIAPKAQAPVATQAVALILPDNVFIDAVEIEEELPSVFPRPVLMVHSSVDSSRAKHDWLDPGYLSVTLRSFHPEAS